MTGRFQKMWGDFGGSKPQAALEYECFRSQALSAGNSVGDQLPPRGTLDSAAYDLIGAVYAQCEAAEPFYAILRLTTPAKGVAKVNEVRVFGTGKLLARTTDDTGWVLPAVKGRLLLEVPGFF